MDKNKQSQSAGDNSTQIQAGTINYYVGIDEVKARQICQQEYAIARQNWTEEAVRIADDRVHQLEDKLMPKMVKYDSTFSIFADPAFQLTIREAQISAAASERESDYEMLSELVLHRAKHNQEREKRLGVSKAIEIVNDVSDEALIALAIVYALIKYSPISGILSQGLTTMNNLYGCILGDSPLPNNNDWIEQLGLLSAIRISPSGFNSFKKMKEYMPEKLSKYLVSGVLKDSEEYINIVSKFEKCGIPLTCLIPHPLKKGYSILNNTLNVDEMKITQHIGDLTISRELNEEQKTAMQSAINLLRKKESGDINMQNVFMEEWDNYPYLKRVHEWWDSLNMHFIITPSGEALANAYIRTKFPGIPGLY